MHSGDKQQHQGSWLILTSVSLFQLAPQTAHNLAILPPNFRLKKQQR